jgi:adenylate kinase
VVRLIFFGPPGAGKGTQAVAVANLLQVPHISTGDLFRAAVSAQSALGLKAQSYLDQGELVPDDVVVDMIQERLTEDDTQSGWILDGFPRTLAQAQALDTLLAHLGQAYDRVVNLEVPDAVLVERMLSRGRNDDTETVIRRRLQVYQDQTAPLIDYYRDRKRLVDIDGHTTVDEVTARIKTAVLTQ